MEWLLIPGFAILNRASGMDRWFPGRNIYATAILAGLFGLWLFGWAGGLSFFLGMLTYRILGWYKLLDIGTVEGDPLTEFVLMAVRSLLFFPPYVWLLLTGHPPGVLVAFWLLSGLGCAVGYAVGMHVKHKLDPGLVAEVIAGTAIGACLFGAVTYT